MDNFISFIKKNITKITKMEHHIHMCLVTFQLKNQENIMGVKDGNRIKGARNSSHGVCTYPQNFVYKVKSDQTFL